MRKIRIFEHVSLDGVISPPGDSDFAQGGWSAPYRTPDGAAALAKTQGASFDLLLGRRTYDLWATYWPKIKGGPFADNLNAATKYVATHRPESLGWPRSRGSFRFPAPQNCSAWTKISEPFPLNLVGFSDTVIE